MMDHTNKKVTLYFRISKMDQEGHGVRRTLQCLCLNNLCERECPYKVTYDLVDKVEKFNGSNTPVAMMKDKKPATKAQIVKTWRWLYGQGVSGHSGRRSGALSIFIIYQSRVVHHTGGASGQMEIQCDTGLCGGSAGTDASKSADPLSNVGQQRKPNSGE